MTQNKFESFTPPSSKKDKGEDPQEENIQEKPSEKKHLSKKMLIVFLIWELN